MYTPHPPGMNHRLDISCSMIVYNPKYNTPSLLAGRSTASEYSFLIAIAVQGSFASLRPCCAGRSEIENTLAGRASKHCHELYHPTRLGYLGPTNRKPLTATTHL